LYDLLINTFTSSLDSFNIYTPDPCEIF